MNLRDLPVALRPRERLLESGPGALTDAELLAIVLGTGRGSGEDALGLAHRVLNHIGDATALARCDVEGVPSVPGVGPVKAARVRAAFALAARARGLLSAPHAPQASPAARVDTGVSSYAERLGAMYRDRVAVGETALLGHREESAAVTLALGERLGQATRPGAVLARLLAEGGDAPWTIVSVRPGGPPTARERRAAHGITRAAGLLGMTNVRVVIVGRVGVEVTAEVAPC